MKEIFNVFILVLPMIIFSGNIFAAVQDNIDEIDYDSFSGIDICFGLTSLYQANIHGGLSTNDRKGRFAGRYDLELSADLEKMLGIRGGLLFIKGWGGWPDTGIDEKTVGSAWGINGLSIGNRSMDIVELFYEGPLFNDNLGIMIGKLDFTGLFDATEYADDECTQFLNMAFINDPVIPFPEQGLGVALNWNITDSLYLMAGATDAQADSRETGFRTAFQGEQNFFYVLEGGKFLEINSLNGYMPGTYRFGFWIDQQDKDSMSTGKTIRNDSGFYLSFDQMLYKEDSRPNDSQGLGCFARYGWANSEYNSITNFFSLGLQYQGLFAEKNYDVCGLGYSRGFFSNRDSINYPEDYESVLEAYYNFHLSPLLIISPSMQYITGPSNGEGSEISDAFVIGIRLTMMF